MTLQLPDPKLPWPIALAGVYEIAKSENLELVAYLCPARIPTLGWGETEGVHLGDTCTKEQADQWLLEDLQDRTRKVQALLKVPTSPNQLAALVSLAYNIGVEALAGSSVLKRHNAGDFIGAAQAMDWWNKARVDGVLQELPGLTSRRKREAALYLAPEPGQRAEPMPQAVQPESKLIGSPTVLASGAGLVATVKEALDKTSATDLVVQAGERSAALNAATQAIKAFAVDTLGLPEWLLPVGLAVLFATILWRRFGQRRRGVA